jgi:hypothetical protein
VWAEHFARQGVRIVGRTAAGRVTVQVLAMNAQAQLDARRDD